MNKTVGLGLAAAAVVVALVVGAQLIELARLQPGRTRR